ncbi:hypothetical protein PGT21_014815 [Puccinia graminis f. sp. tritici]|uniref:Uncharacterized protein n=2 Tax=Puccinia graminis f. sp. tritici TaxID=56615 RepID=E3L7U9_PUCGT|nr:uncharacterized protein PGTG_18623 [Puccinia graminis f. sp. tritici CRL 75-36-700-3]KAA1073534.1 hypothetical protein PGT21_014815 [Puccinia graminis f. sp. tritici]EFP92624.1 hypothetical protein PGTG_18623 [Puccinia graminis f. sp. tritici CRL 75-36-700-3]KAA1122126.1 hypothetical protein PGTUg99_028966 [Puccinia graminis f. sp. tritici]CBL69127.1 hypothetical protein [Puccinia graminis f. sp. tritici]CBL69128.1 hypothetical protein [Puccinia graminis f. sp. tritici]
MLFKYLMATVALAAVVISSPTEPTTVAKPADSLSQCENAITQVKEPVVVSCKEGKVEKVKSHLITVQKPIQVLSFTFSSSSSIVIQKEVVTKYSQEFIKVLIKFQSVLTVIYSHPKISAGCTEVFAKLDSHFDSICTVFKEKHGVEIYKMIHEESSINVTVWEKTGFKFQSKGGYSTISH